jgi:hypothetical protein
VPIETVMLALRTAPPAIRFALAALTLLFAVYAGELVFTFCPRSSPTRS